MTNTLKTAPKGLEVRTPNKLVRDRILYRIIGEGRKFSVRMLSGKELVLALIDKLHEEAQELRAAIEADDTDNIAEEMADIATVWDGLDKHVGTNWTAAHKGKLERSGGYNEGVFLEWFEFDEQPQSDRARSGRGPFGGWADPKET